MDAEFKSIVADTPKLTLLLCGIIAGTKKKKKKNMFAQPRKKGRLVQGVNAPDPGPAKKVCVS